jgi:cell division protein FtsQ
MWDNARFLNAVADVLYLVAAALVVWAVAQAAARVPFLPLRTVSVVGNPAHVDVEAVSAALEGRIAGNFFGLELADVRRELAKLPWVHRVEARREWPDRIVVRFEEHRALARWSDSASGDRLVSTHGGLFDAEPDEWLPQLAGPPGTERWRAATSRSASSSRRSVRRRRT